MVEQPAPLDVFEVLFTTRSMRRLLPDPVPMEVLSQLIQAATMAPTDSFRQRWRFIAVTDATTIAGIGRLFSRSFDQVRDESKAGLPESIFRSVTDLGTAFGDAPALILVGGIDAPEGRHQSRAYLNFYAGLYPAVQNLLIAARAVGLGATLTTLVISLAEGEVKELLGIADEGRLVAAIPIGWPRGRFGRPYREPVHVVSYLNRWGNPLDSPRDASDLYPRVPLPPEPPT